MTAVFPLWKKDTTVLVREFLAQNFKTITCCVNDAYLEKEQVGEVLTSALIDSFPSNVDPCGENGEFHTFCFDGPLFRKKVDFIKGEKVYKGLDLKYADTSSTIVTKGFWFCELLPIS